MKKILKKCIAVLISLSVLSSVSFSASAVISPIYEIDNEEYREMIDSLHHRVVYDEEFTSFLNSLIAEPPEGYNIPEIKHVYSRLSETKLSHTYYCDEEIKVLPDYRTARRITSYVVRWGSVHSKDVDFYKEHSVDELNAFLKENNLNAWFEESSEHPEYDIFYEELNEENLILTLLKLNEEYGMVVHIGKMALHTPYLYDISIKTKFGTQTIAGDVNVDNVFSVADISRMTKYIVSAELYPIVDSTALANADVNQDGIIDSVDKNEMLVMFLGTFKTID